MIVSSLLDKRVMNKLKRSHKFLDIELRLRKDILQVNLINNVLVERILISLRKQARVENGKDLVRKLITNDEYCSHYLLKIILVESSIYSCCMPKIKEAKR